MTPGAELKNDFAWSWSRHQVFYDCPRRLYWQYYGSWGGWDHSAPPTAALAYRLKKILSIPMLVGKIFHQVLADLLRRRPDRPQPVPAAQLRADMERRLLKRLAESKSRDWEKRGSPARYTNLFEDYYGPGVDDAMRDKALADVRACVAGFAGSVYGRRAFSVPRERLVHVESSDFDKMRLVVDGVSVFAAPDFIVKDGRDRFHVVEWKTGRSEKAEPAQLGVYGLFAADKFGVSLEELTAHLVYVKTGASEAHPDLRQGAANAHAMLETYVQDVRGRLTDVPGNVAADLERFPMTTDLRKCRRCNFRELCGRTDEAPQPPDGSDD